MIELPKCFDYIYNRFDIKEEYVTIGRIITSKINGYWGTTLLSTALVPNEDLDDLLSSYSSSGYEVENNGPFPDLGDDEEYINIHQIRGLNGKTYKPLIHYWTNHNKTTILPIPELLMVYGLTPRNIQNRVVWDDLRKPVFTVIDNLSRSDYYFDEANGYINSDAFVKIRKDYLEDYAKLKNASIVAFYFEERWISGEDDFIEKQLAGKPIVEYKLPSNRLKLMKTLADKYNFNCQVHGRQLVFTPTERPISNPKQLKLVWPDINTPVTPQEAMSCKFDKVFVNDAFLKNFENKSEFLIYPESGGVDYDGRWCIVRTDRISRNVVEIELNKLYETNPDYIIKLIHSYAISKEEASQDLAIYGQKNIGQRAKSYVYAFVDLFETISVFCDMNLLDFDTEDFISISKSKLDYYGWFKFEDFSILYNVVDIDCDELFFKNRAKIIYKLIEKISAKTLRKVLVQIGFKSKKELSGFGSLILLSYLLQIVEISNENDFDIISDMELIISNFNDEYFNDDLSSLFSLNNIRIMESHSFGSDLQEKYNAALKNFGIEVEDNRGIGWGLSVDILYDKLFDSLLKLKSVFEQYINENNT